MAIILESINQIKKILQEIDKQKEISNVEKIIPILTYLVMLKSGGTVSVRSYSPFPKKVIWFDVNKKTYQLSYNNQRIYLHEITSRDNKFISTFSA